MKEKIKNFEYEIEISDEIKVKIFDFDEKKNKIPIIKEISAVQINLPTNNPIISLEEISKNDLKKYLGKCEYRFRKGVGYKGEFYRLQLKEIGKNGEFIFYRFKKENRKLKVDKNSLLVLESKELKYIYPLVLSPEITDQKFRWGKNYIIFPYKRGEKQPVSEKDFKEEAPHLYNYLSSHKSEIMKQSRYNKRIQNVKEFYGVIRVGDYSYSKYFVAIRDNTKLASCIVSEITTEWGEKKNPVFDNHVSYVPLDTKEEAEYLLKKLREPKLKKLVNVLFDSRSIGSRLPFKIPKYKVKK